MKITVETEFCLFLDEDGKLSVEEQRENRNICCDICRWDSVNEWDSYLYLSSIVDDITDKFPNAVPGIYWYYVEFTVDFSYTNTTNGADWDASQEVINLDIQFIREVNDNEIYTKE